MKKTICIVGGKKTFEHLTRILLALGLKVINENTEGKIKRLSRLKSTGLFILDLGSLKKGKLKSKLFRVLSESGKKFIVLASGATFDVVREAREAGAADCIIKPYNQREFISRFNAVLNNKRRISCIGGGTGIFHLLLGLKSLPGVLLTSIVNTTDDGGSSGRLKASLGILPPGDVRRSLVALSNAPEMMNKVMLYRFRKIEGLAGHSLGNLFLTALTDINRSFSKAVKAIGDIMNIQGIVQAVAKDPTTLFALFEDGTVIKGESMIDIGKGRNLKLRIKKVWHEPPIQCSVEAFSSIINSDIVILGPGDLFTSIITNVLVKNINSALAETKAKKIYICNLMTKPGETPGYDACDHVREIVKYTGGGRLDYVIISNTKLSKKAMREYAGKGQIPVKAGDTDEIRRMAKGQIILSDVGDSTDLVRHNEPKIRKAIKAILS
ncbi:MAG: uridine diphosphate-N-acetylglucosamine-binding protein YvcK [Candidatus Omnitrophica bacterium]|nr:uridine diphosphate-N-acetylglucosamine-binding protein YvcK [Candidatus Omnitrophota bacterium]